MPLANWQDFFQETWKEPRKYLTRTCERVYTLHLLMELFCFLKLVMDFWLIRSFTIWVGRTAKNPKIAALYISKMENILCFNQTCEEKKSQPAREVISRSLSSKIFHERIHGRSWQTVTKYYKKSVHACCNSGRISVHQEKSAIAFTIYCSLGATGVHLLTNLSTKV